MKRKWTVVRDILKTYEPHKDIFLSIISGDGTILCANALMVKALELKQPGKEKNNFFDLLHPVNVNDFKEAIHHLTGRKDPYPMELYVKNGYYHPMKWQINYVKTEKGEDAFLCAGHKITNDDRMKQFYQLGQKNYELIVEGLSTGILFQDKNGEIIAVNRMMAEIFDTTLERLYQLTDIKTLWNTAWNITLENGEPASFENTPFIRALQTGEAQSGLLVVTIRSNEQRWLYFNSQPLLDSKSNTPYAVVTNITDLSNEKKLILELQEKKAVLKAFMDQTPNLTWVVDENSNLVFASRAFYKYFKLEEENSLNKKITDLVPLFVTKALYEKHQEVLQTGMSVRLSQKVKWADGTDYVFHITIFPVEGEAGRKMLGGHAVNLTDKFAAEKKLKETHDRLLLLTRATTDAIWEWDMQSGAIFRNDALMDMIGYQPAGDQKGLSWWLRRIHPEDRNRLSDKVKESTDSGSQSWQDEYRFKCADGTYKHMRDKGFIVYENGLPVKMIGSLQDISNLKDMENQLMEEKLERQKEISEAIIRAQEKERTGIGHELHDNVNQLLTTSKLFVDMLTPASAEEKELKSKSVEYILMAIEEIRKLSKELVSPQLQDNGLTESIESLISDIELSTRIRIKFTHDHENGLLTPGKKVTLFRIVQEQLKNILKHSQAKNVHIWLERKESDTKLIIKDDGIGFDPTQTHRGIGLSNIYERGKFYNGTVEVNTSPGNGCTLTIVIPSLN